MHEGQLHETCIPCSPQHTTLPSSESRLARQMPCKATLRHVRAAARRCRGITLVWPWHMRPERKGNC